MQNKNTTDRISTPNAPLFFFSQKSGCFIPSLFGLICGHLVGFLNPNFATKNYHYKYEIKMENWIREYPKQI